MKVLPEDVAEKLASGDIIAAGAAKFVFGETYRIWSGYGTLQIDGEDYIGVGASILIAPVSFQIGGGAEAVELRASGLDPDIAQTIENEQYDQKPVILYRIFFDNDAATILGASVFYRGRCDTVRIVEQAGGTAEIIMNVEGPALDLDRAGARVRSDADQRILGGSSDGAFQRLSVAPMITLYWGQKPANSTTLNAGKNGRAPVPLTSIPRI